MFTSLRTLSFVAFPVLFAGIAFAQDRPPSEDEIEAVVVASLRAVAGFHGLAQHDSQEIWGDHIRVRPGSDAPRVPVYAGIQGRVAEALGLPLIATPGICDRPIGTVLYSATVDHMTDRGAIVSAVYFHRTEGGHGSAHHRFRLERTDSEWVVTERIGLVRGHGPCG